SVQLVAAALARGVLAGFGRARGRLPEGPGEPDGEAERFLDGAVSGLIGPDGRIIPVRLCLFAEVVRQRRWAPATLRELGGIEGIGVTFFEETFAAPNAPPAYRAHRRAAEAVLRSLLPDISSDLKGKMRTARELQEAAGDSAP